MLNHNVDCFGFVVVLCLVWFLCLFCFVLSHQQTFSHLKFWGTVSVYYSKRHFLRVSFRLEDLFLRASLVGPEDLLPDSSLFQCCGGSQKSNMYFLKAVFLRAGRGELSLCIQKKAHIVSSLETVIARSISSQLHTGTFFLHSNFMTSLKKYHR